MSKNGNGSRIVPTPELEREIAEFQDVFGFTYDEARSTVLMLEQQRRVRDRQRQRNARKFGYKPPPPEAECPPRPADKCCQLCGRVTKDRPRGPTLTMTPGLDLDHCHFTGRFRGWLCYSCNGAIGRIEKYIGLQRLQAYLVGELGDMYLFETPEAERAVREWYMAQAAKLRAFYT